MSRQFNLKRPSPLFIPSNRAQTLRLSPNKQEQSLRLKNLSASRRRRRKRSQRRQKIKTRQLPTTMRLMKTRNDSSNYTAKNLLTRTNPFSMMVTMTDHILFQPILTKTKLIFVRPSSYREPKIKITKRYKQRLSSYNDNLSSASKSSWT